MSVPPTHAELCAIARKWLINRCACYFAVSELVTYAGEIPDAIGFKSQISIVVECKTSRSDFLKDAKKYHRKNPDMAMGCHRYYLSIPEVIKDCEATNGFGLLHWDGRKVRVIRSPAISERKIYGTEKIRRILDHNNHRLKKCEHKEIAFLTSVVTRLANNDEYIRSKLSIRPGWMNFQRRSA